MKPLEGLDTVMPELAEKWSWQDGYRNLVFFLRKGVRWYDGQPRTARDVKFTFDMVREALDATAKLRINPRKDWYSNVEAIEGRTFPPAELRTRCVGTGPFRLKEWKRGEYIDFTKNPDYLVKGRPYLDGIRYLVVTERGTRTAALQAGRADAASPLDGSPPIADQLRAAVPKMVVTKVGAGVADNLLLNITRPPFNNPRVRRALSLAIDRQAFVKAVLQGAGIPGAALAPPPIGFWGLGARDLVTGDKAQAKQLLAEAGYTAATPLKLEVVTRNLALHTDMSAFVLNELRQVGIDVTPRSIEPVEWFGIAARKEYQMGANISGYSTDDPDSNFFEHYRGPLHAELHGLLRRGDGEAHRPGVPGAEREEAPGPRHADPEEARRRRPPHAGLALRLLRALAVRSAMFAHAVRKFFPACTLRCRICSCSAHFARSICTRC